jgi:hypothetical protein
MAKYPDFSKEMKELLISASRGELSLEGVSKEDAGARWLAHGVMNFLKGRMMLTMVYPTDVVTWKILSDSYGEFDVQVGYAAKSARNITKSVSGRVSAFMQPAGKSLYTLRVVDWASTYTSYYTLTVIQTDDTYRFDDAIKPTPGKGKYYYDWEEVPT